MDKQIGAKIKLLRKSRGIKQAELARYIGVAQQTLCGYETLKSQPDIEVLKRIAEFFNVSTDYLLQVDMQDGTCNTIENDIYLKKINDYARQLNSSNRDIIIGTMAKMVQDQQQLTEETLKNIG